MEDDGKLLEYLEKLVSMFKMYNSYLPIALSLKIVCGIFIESFLASFPYFKTEDLLKGYFIHIFNA